MTLKSESSLNQTPNLLESDFELLMIQFGMPNRLSLVPSIKILITPRSVMNKEKIWLNTGLIGLQISKFDSKKLLLLCYGLFLSADLQLNHASILLHPSFC